MLHHASQCLPIVVGARDTLRNAMSAPVEAPVLNAPETMGRGPTIPGLARDDMLMLGQLGIDAAIRNLATLRRDALESPFLASGCASSSLRELQRALWYDGGLPDGTRTSWERTEAVVVLGVAQAALYSMMGTALWQCRRSSEGYAWFHQGLEVLLELSFLLNTTPTTEVPPVASLMTSEAMLAMCDRPVSSLAQAPSPRNLRGAYRAAQSIVPAFALFDDVPQQPLVVATPIALGCFHGMLSLQAGWDDTQAVHHLAWLLQDWLAAADGTVKVLRPTLLTAIAAIQEAAATAKAAAAAASAEPPAPNQGGDDSHAHHQALLSAAQQSHAALEQQRAAVQDAQRLALQQKLAARRAKSAPEAASSSSSSLRPLLHQWMTQHPALSSEFLACMSVLADNSRSDSFMPQTGAHTFSDTSPWAQVFMVAYRPDFETMGYFFDAIVTEAQRLTGVLLTRAVGHLAPMVAPKAAVGQPPTLQGGESGPGRGGGASAGEGDDITNTADLLLSRRRRFTEAAENQPIHVCAVVRWTLTALDLRLCALSVCPPLTAEGRRATTFVNDNFCDWAMVAVRMAILLLDHAEEAIRDRELDGQGSTHSGGGHTDPTITSGSSSSASQSSSILAIVPAPLIAKILTCAKQALLLAQQRGPEGMPHDEFQRDLRRVALMAAAARLRVRCLMIRHLSEVFEAIHEENDVADAGGAPGGEGTDARKLMPSCVTASVERRRLATFSFPWSPEWLDPVRIDAAGSSSPARSFVDGLRNPFRGHQGADAAATAGSPLLEVASRLLASTRDDDPVVLPLDMDGPITVARVAMDLVQRVQCDATLIQNDFNSADNISSAPTESDLEDLLLSFRGSIAALKYGRAIVRTALGDSLASSDDITQDDVRLAEHVNRWRSSALRLLGQLRSLQLDPVTFRNVLTQADYDAANVHLEFADDADVSSSSVNPSSSESSEHPIPQALLIAVGAPVRPEEIKHHLEKSLENFTQFVQRMRAQDTAAEQPGANLLPLDLDTEVPGLILAEVRRAHVLLKLGRVAEARSVLQLNVVDYLHTRLRRAARTAGHSSSTTSGVNKTARQLALETLKGTLRDQYTFAADTLLALQDIPDSSSAVRVVPGGSRTSAVEKKSGGRR